MANPEHLRVVTAGSSALRAWRAAHPHVRLDLASAVLSGANLKDSDLSFSTLHMADFRGGNLSGALFVGSEISHVDFLGADLSAANLTGTELTRVNLSNADLSDATFVRATLMELVLARTNFERARFGATSVGMCDLSQSIGLDSAKHLGPSSIGVETLMLSVRGAGNRMTDQLQAFFRGAGVALEVLLAIPTIRCQIRHYNCFISYGEPDRSFAEKLRADLEQRDVSCWLYSMDSIPGERTWREVGERRRNAERFVVVCSVSALVRDGVLKEIEEQIDDAPETILPISLDTLWIAPGFRVIRGNRDLKPFLLERNYVDFARLPYEAALSKLLAGLRRVTPVARSEW